jgi:hypothetical protein
MPDRAERACPLFPPLGQVRLCSCFRASADPAALESAPHRSLRRRRTRPTKEGSASWLSQSVPEATFQLASIAARSAVERSRCPHRRKFPPVPDAAAASGTRLGAAIASKIRTRTVSRRSFSDAGAAPAQCAAQKRGPAPKGGREKRQGAGLRRSARKALFTPGLKGTRPRVHTCTFRLKAQEGFAPWPTAGPLFGRLSGSPLLGHSSVGSLRREGSARTLCSPGILPSSILRATSCHSGFVPALNRAGVERRPGPPLAIPRPSL